MDETELQLPPNHVELEQSILGGILEHPELISTAVGLLQPEHFYNSVHQQIFRCMLDCFAKQAPIEPNAMFKALQATGNLEAVTVKNYIVSIMLSGAGVSRVLDDYSLRYWSKQLIELARRRELITVCRDIQGSAFDMSNETYMQEAENLLFLMSQAYPEEEQKTIGVVEEAIATIEQELTAPNGLTGLSTGFASLDRITHGFQPYQLITVSARPGGGKSAFALNVASHVVLNERKPVLYISLEMTSVELMKRLIKAKSGSHSDLEKLKNAAGSLKALQRDFILEDAAGQTLSAIQSKILKAKKQRPDLGLIVIDHIGLIAPEQKSKPQNRAYEIQGITSRFKAISKTVQVPILQLAQMNRQIDARQDKKPMLSDLRDSGSIEMDSDIVLFTHIDRDEERRPSGDAVLTVAKQRDGVQAEIQLKFVPHLTLFQEPFYPKLKIASNT